MSTCSSSSRVAGSVRALASIRSANSSVTSGVAHSRACSCEYASTPTREPSRCTPRRSACTVHGRAGTSVPWRPSSSRAGPATGIGSPAEPSSTVARNRFGWRALIAAATSSVVLTVLPAVSVASDTVRTRSR